MEVLNRCSFLNLIYPREFLSRHEFLNSKSSTDFKKNVVKQHSHLLQACFAVLKTILRKKNKTTE